MTVEVLITIGIVAFAVCIMYTNFRKKSLGECGCGHCNKPKRKLRRKS